MTGRSFYRVYGYVECEWCVKAKDLLFMHGLSSEIVNITDRDERVDWMNERDFQGNDRTFPKVYKVDYKNRETLIGGYTELSARIAEGM